MNINYFKWSELASDLKDKLLRRASEDIEQTLERVRPIIADVRFNGDGAICTYTSKYEQIDLRPDQLKVTEDDFAHARQIIDPHVKAAIDYCIGNVKRFHEEQMRRVEREWMVEVQPGIFAGEKITPIESVGIYAPGGKNRFPSSAYMLCVPAVMAGVEKIVLMTPAQKDGTVGAATLYAAEVSGVKTVFKGGGAQAIAALAYGTQSIPKVAKVVGPCSPYGAAAKQLLANVIDPGMPAGPSESIILSDGSSDPHNTVLDLLNEAEHGPDSSVLLITHDTAFAKDILARLPEAITALPEKSRTHCTKVFETYGGIIITDSLAESIALANEFAVEHIMLKVKNPEAVAANIVNAGEILLGEHSAISPANYGTGVNHVLPTGGLARSYSCTSVWDFLKRTSLNKTTFEGLKPLQKPVAIMAEYEGFPAHANAILKRKGTE